MRSPQKNTQGAGNGDQIWDKNWVEEEVEGWLTLFCVSYLYPSECVPNAYLQRISNFTKGKRIKGFV